MNGKISNPKQVISAFDVLFESGEAKGKSCILVHNGLLEALISKDNALDILYVKYAGVNLSFMTKNGINTKEGDFLDRFDGGFLYTCGIENIGKCVEGVIQHGSFHYIKADQVNVVTDDQKVVISGYIKTSKLFGLNLVVYRTLTVYPDKIELKDVIKNCDFVDGGYVLLYHNNYGYPFLDKDLVIEMDLVKSEGVTDYAKANIADQLKMSDCIDGGDEQCFYNYLKDNVVNLVNKRLGLKVKVVYDKKMLPELVEWKSMISGDYALGIEPATCRFDNFKLTPISSGEEKTINITYSFEKI